ncbi:hypothetical protein [Haladaptatus sp. NG-SE-30]
MEDNSSTTTATRSVWTARPTILVFAFLSVTWFLPTFVDIYSFVLYRLLFIPAYLVMLLVYDAPWGLENVVYALDGVLPQEKYVWEIGLLVTYYLVAAALTWLGRRLRGIRRPRTIHNTG